MEEKDFEICLRNIESRDPIRRRQGVISLEKIGDNRAFNVAKALLTDEDFKVREQAERIYDLLSRKNKKAVFQHTEPVKDVETLSEIWEVFDEVGFIIKRNVGAIYLAAAVSGAAKLLLAISMCVSKEIIPFDSYALYNSLFSIGPVLFTIHQLVFRPFIWLTVGRAFLAGFQDKNARALSKIPISFSGYLAMMFTNLLQFVPIAALAYFILSRSVFGADILVKTLCFMVLVYFYYVSIPLLPVQLLDSSNVGSTLSKSLSIFSEKKSFLKQSYPTFLVLSLAFYCCIAGNAAIVMGWITSSDSEVLIYPAILIADVLIDPFWIGYRILTTRLFYKNNA